MALTIGAKLGPYEVISAIGAGGMGEVYKARDTRLSRTVAIKVLPERVAAEILARFGDIVTRISVYTPYAPDTEQLTALTAALRRAS